MKIVNQNIHNSTDCIQIEIIKISISIRSFHFNLFCSSPAMCYSSSNIANLNNNYKPTIIHNNIINLTIYFQLLYLLLLFSKYVVCYFDQKQ